MSLQPIKSLDPTAYPYRDDLFVDTRVDEARDAVKSLSHWVTPDHALLGRESDTKSILNSLNSMLQKSSFSDKALGGTILLCGPPGTGKTATVRYCIQQLNTQLNNQFYPVEVNAMKLSNADMIYQAIWLRLNEAIAEISDQQRVSLATLGKARAQGKLEEFFRTGKADKPILLFLDELEMIFTPDQQIIYTLFDWAGSPKAQLCIVGISNMIDIVDRVHQKVRSRMGSKIFRFNSYSAQELYNILEQRALPFEALFENMHSVLDYIAKKIGASKGDARLALEVTRQTVQRVFSVDSNLSIEQASLDNSSANAETILIGIKHINETLIHMRQDPRPDTLENLPLHGQYWILACLIEIGLRIQYRNQIDSFQFERLSKPVQEALQLDITFYDLTYYRYLDLVNRYPVFGGPLSMETLFEIAQKVSQLSIVSLDFEDLSFQSRVNIIWDPYEIISTLSKNPLTSMIIENENFDVF